MLEDSVFQTQQGCEKTLLCHLMGKSEEQAVLACSTVPVAAGSSASVCRQHPVFHEMIIPIHIHQFSLQLRCQNLKKQNQPNKNPTLILLTAVDQVRIWQPLGSGRFL